MGLFLLYFGHPGLIKIGLSGKTFLVRIKNEYLQEMFHGNNFL